MKRSGTASNTVVEVERLLSATCRSSSICFAVFDADLRFRALNETVARAHALSIEHHLGNLHRDIVPDIAVRADPLLQRVLHTRRPSSFEVSGKLPRRSHTDHWVTYAFPIGTAPRKVRQIAVLAVGVTELMKLDDLYTRLPARLVATAEQQGLLAELHGSIREYKAALGLNLKSISNAARDPQTTVELFSESLQRLDERMQALVAALTKSMPVSGQ